jgi:hypothetical protein
MTVGIFLLSFCPIHFPDSSASHTHTHTRPHFNPAHLPECLHVSIIQSVSACMDLCVHPSAMCVCRSLSSLCLCPFPYDQIRQIHHMSVLGNIENINFAQENAAPSKNKTRLVLFLPPGVRNKRRLGLHEIFPPYIFPPYIFQHGGTNLPKEDAVGTHSSSSRHLYWIHGNGYTTNVGV